MDGVASDKSAHKGSLMMYDCHDNILDVSEVKARSGI